MDAAVFVGCHFLGLYPFHPKLAVLQGADVALTLIQPCDSLVPAPLECVEAPGV